MPKPNYSGPERRKYIRLDSVFPVSFQVLSLDSKKVFSDWLQGFTRDVSRGGLCLIANRLDHDLVNALKKSKMQVALQIEIPLNTKPITAQAEVCWIKASPGDPHKYMVGLSYTRINPYQNNKLVRYARYKKLFAPVALTIILVTGLGFVLNTYLNIKLFRGTNTLVAQLVKIAQDSSVAKQKIKAINREKEDLQLKIETVQLQIQNAKEEKLIEKLSKNKSSLQEQLISVQYRENDITEKLLSLDEAKRTIEKASFDQIFIWLKSCQNPRTGLVSSFNVKSDIIDWAYLSEQSLVALAYAHFGDFERTRKILDFFSKKAQRQKGLFFHAYSASEGSPIDLTVNKSANIWLGIAILQYTQKSQDRRYLYLARGIAKAIMNSGQGKEENDQPAIDTLWQANEEDLETYVFYNMLYTMTDKPLFKTKRDEVFNRLIGAGSLLEHTCSITAIGPEKLKEKGINPDRIIEFSEQKYAVEASLSQPEGQLVKIRGFDFRAGERTTQDKAIFAQDTAKMVLVYKMMRDFYHQKAMVAKARSYKNKANEYLAGLVNLAIFDSTASAVGAGSLAGRAYLLFAYYNYNPLQFQE